MKIGALQAYLKAQGLELAGPLHADLIPGGRSNLTYAVTDGARRWVVRRPSAAGLTASAHDMAREWRVTSALRATRVPVARPVILCQDQRVMGAPFTVVEWVDGIVVRSRDDLGSLPGDQLRRTIGALVEVLAALHAVDITTAGLGGFGRPEGFLARQVALWRRQWEQISTRQDPDLERLHARVAAAIPASCEAAVIHGDYRIDNIFLDRSDRGRIGAVIDWELSAIGDPLTDVALMCVYRHPALNVILGIPATWTSPRVPPPDALAETYARLSGRDLGDWPFCQALAHLKLAVIAEGIAWRARAGADADRDAARAAKAAPELIAAGLRALGRR
jgi:aminoglycoside phosphotransferase (APT) family kinase protein